MRIEPRAAREQRDSKQCQSAFQVRKVNATTPVKASPASLNYFHPARKSCAGGRIQARSCSWGVTDPAVLVWKKARFLRMIFVYMASIRQGNKREASSHRDS